MKQKETSITYYKNKLITNQIILALTNNIKQMFDS